jgi:D-tyrosyl-tRNA(Tyr) deacylase
MIAVAERVSEASVTVAGESIARIGNGLLILLGVEKSDTEEEAAWLARKIAGLRIFEDEESKFNLSLLDVEGEALVVSQFTLLGDCRKGKRPDFTRSAPAAEAERLYEVFKRELAGNGVPVSSGVFGAMMDVRLINRGPVTVIVQRQG